MLTSTFCHFPKIGPATERKLWSAGITSWGDLRAATGKKPFRGFSEGWLAHAEESEKRHADGDPEYFARDLPASCHWRLYREYQDSCAFVDIETDGLPPYCEITTAVLYDGREVRWYVSGRNLDDLGRDLRAYKILVTYNGKCFDVPVIERQLGVRLPDAHIDLRHVLASLGLKGGLKGCERQLGMIRPEMNDVDGFLALLLWEEYCQSGEDEVLETLLAYNVQDTVNLHALMVHSYNEKLKSTPFRGTYTLPNCTLPKNPFRVDRGVVSRVRSRLFGSSPVSWQPPAFPFATAGHLTTAWR